MLKKYKSKIIISSLIILLPILFGAIMWDSLTAAVSSDGNVGISGENWFVIFTVFGVPISILIPHLVCLFFTLSDKRQKEQSKKALGMVFLICPLASVFSAGILYSVILGKKLDFLSFFPIILGVIFIFIGNYLPKIKPNRTIGIKVSTAMNNEENWNKTHRFSGKLWVIGGLIMLFSVFLPSMAWALIMVLVIIAMAVIPDIYSHYIYKQHQKAGIVYTAQPKTKGEKAAAAITAAVIIIAVIGSAILLFTGDIEIYYEDDFFRINADFYGDLKVSYSEIDNIEYRNGFDMGTRTNGFGSPRLSMGKFSNDEFGSYTLYAYTKAEEFIVITKGTKKLVVGMSNSEDTKAIYDTMLEKIEK